MRTKALNPVARVAALTCVAAALVGAALVPRAAVATMYPLTATDVILLRTDMVVFATVSAIKTAPDDAQASDVTLADVNPVAGRWNLRAGAPLALRFRGTPAPRDLRVNRDLPPLVEGRRYVFFLQGGPWTEGPIIRFNPGIYEVREGTVRCPGGEVFALGEYGLICGTRERVAGAPMTESALADRVRAALAVARVRRSAEARLHDEHAQPLSLRRSSAGGAP